MNNPDLPTDWRIEQYVSLGSTNDLAKARARAGAAGHLAILADEQTSGRGRMGRTWVAPAGSSLLVSLLLRFTDVGARRAVPLQDADVAHMEGRHTGSPVRALRAEHAYLLTMLASVALCEAVAEVAAVSACLKWPNDLMLKCSDSRVRKAGGILAEIDIRDNQVVWVVLGIGVNLNWQPTGSIDGRELRHSATSVAAVSGESIDRMAFLAALLQRIDYHLVRVESQVEALHVEWRNRLMTLGQRVTIRLPDRVVQGLAEDVTEQGSLCIRMDNGQVQIVTAGDVEA